MREIVKRMFVVFWIGWVTFSAFLLNVIGPSRLIAWQIIGWSGAALWGLQFIATGIANPFVLFETTEFRQK